MSRRTIVPDARNSAFSAASFLPLFFFELDARLAAALRRHRRDAAKRRAVGHLKRLPADAHLRRKCAEQPVDFERIVWNWRPRRRHDALGLGEEARLAEPRDRTPRTRRLQLLTLVRDQIINRRPIEQRLGEFVAE